MSARKTSTRPTTAHRALLGTIRIRHATKAVQLRAIAQVMPRVSSATRRLVATVTAAMSGAVLIAASARRTSTPPRTAAAAARATWTMQITARGCARVTWTAAGMLKMFRGSFRTASVPAAMSGTRRTAACAHLNSMRVMTATFAAMDSLEIFQIAILNANRRETAVGTTRTLQETTTPGATVRAGTSGWGQTVASAQPPTISSLTATRAPTGMIPRTAPRHARQQQIALTTPHLQTALRLSARASVETNGKVRPAMTASPITVQPTTVAPAAAATVAILPAS